MSVTPGPLGGMAAHHQLRQALFVVNIATLPQPEMYIANVSTLLGPDGAVTNERTRDLLEKYMEAFAAWIERLTLGREADAVTRTARRG